MWCFWNCLEEKNGEADQTDSFRPVLSRKFSTETESAAAFIQSSRSSGSVSPRIRSSSHSGTAPRSFRTSSKKWVLASACPSALPSFRPSVLPSSRPSALPSAQALACSSALMVSGAHLSASSFPLHDRIQRWTWLLPPISGCAGIPPGFPPGCIRSQPAPPLP